VQATARSTGEAHALDERSRDVLKALIQVHIATGEPVGSETLSRQLNRSLSPATLRNIMAELERNGLLNHPHTSAGRVPTDDGYRVYVDSLAGHGSLSRHEAARIRSSLKARDKSMQEVLESASHVLSQMSRNIGFVLGPEITRTGFMHVDFVPLAHPRILVVMVSGAGLVTNKVIEVDEDISPEDLQACANYLNSEFSGLTLDTVRQRLIEMMRHEKALYDSLLRKVIAVGKRAFAAVDDQSEIYLDGTSNVLSQPEFDDMDRMRSLFRTFEQKSRLIKILNACISGDGLRIVIGSENPDPELQDLALVTAGYPVDGQTLFGVGVIGATRMEYARVICLVDHVARAVSRALGEASA